MTYNPTPNPSPWLRGGESCAQANNKMELFRGGIVQYFTFSFAITMHQTMAVATAYTIKKRGMTGR